MGWPAKHAPTPTHKLHAPKRGDKTTPACNALGGVYEQPRIAKRGESVDCARCLKMAGGGK